MKTLALLFVLASVSLDAQIINVPEEYPLIQWGIYAARPGDTVLVADGVYYEQISFMGKPITVASHYIMDKNPAHIDHTILDGSLFNVGEGSVVYFTSGEDTNSVLNGFTVQNGKGTLRVIPGGEKYLSGGGVYLENSGGKIINNRFLNNNLSTMRKDWHGVIPQGAAISAMLSETPNWIVIVNNKFIQNTIVSYDRDAGGAAVYSEINTRLTNNTLNYNTTSVTQQTSISRACVTVIASPGSNINFTAKDNFFRFNSTYGNQHAMGAAMMTSFVRNQIHNNRINDNKTVGNGSAIFLESPVSGVIKGNWIAGNIADVDGGAITFTYPTSVITITENTFHGNKAAKGGAIYGNSSMFVYQNEFVENLAKSDGGALLITGGNHVCSVENNIFNHNGSNRGGAISALNTDLNLVNNVFLSNHALNSYGGAVNLIKTGTAHAHATVVNNSFSENSAIKKGGAMYTFNCIADYLNNIFWKNDAPLGAEVGTDLGSGYIAYTNVNTEGVSGPVKFLQGITYFDPQFSPNTNLMPESNSPCLEKGNGVYAFPGGDAVYAPAYDIRGMMRPANTQYDMGAYEVNVSTNFKSMDIAKEDQVLTVYPNPFISSFRLNYHLKDQADVSVVLYDMLGKTRITWHEIQNAGDYSVLMEQENLPVGMYLLKIKINDTEMVKRIMKQ